MSKPTLTRWYVYPHTSTVNRIISDVLEGQGFQGVILCKTLEDGLQNYPLWEVPRPIVRTLGSERLARNQFTVFVQEGNLAIREFNPEKAKKLSKKKEQLKFVRASTLAPI